MNCNPPAQRQVVEHELRDEPLLAPLSHSSYASTLPLPQTVDCVGALSDVDETGSLGTTPNSPPKLSFVVHAFRVLVPEQTVPSLKSSQKGALPKGPFSTWK